MSGIDPQGNYGWITFINTNMSTSLGKEATPSRRSSAGITINKRRI